MHKTILLIGLLSLLLMSCPQKKQIGNIETQDTRLDSINVNTSLQTLLDSSKLVGSILIYDQQKDVFMSNDFQWAKTGKIPASTYKIPHSIIALEKGIIENENTLIKWDGTERNVANWNRDLILKDAFKYSCVPCFQQIARKIGPDSMIAYLKPLDYGNMDIRINNIDQFWLQGNSTISQYEQIDFLKRLYFSQLPISKRTENIVKGMMLMEQNQNYSLRGKTGWSDADGRNIGWFVGYINVENEVYFFATNVEPDEDFDIKDFGRIRFEITYKAMQKLGIIKD